MLGMSQTRIRDKAGTTGITSVGQSVITSDTADEIKSIIDVGIADVDGLDAALDGLDLALDSKADLVGGFVPTSQIPALAITEFLDEVANQTEMLALNGDRGDWCIRTDTGTVFILNADDSSLLASWTEVEYPASPVSSVNGQTGVVVLGADDVGAAAEGHDHDAEYDAIGSAAAAVAGAGILAQFPLSGTGSVYANIAGTGVNNLALGRSLEYATGIYIASELSVATMRIVLQLTSAGTVARFAIKPIIQTGANKGKPGNPVWTSGECDFSATGEKDTAVGVTLAPGWYALCAAFFNGSANPQFLAGNVSGSYPTWGRTLAAAGGQPINMLYRSGATNAALPDTTGSTWVNNPGANVHVIGLIPS